VRKCLSFEEASHALMRSVRVAPQIGDAVGLWTCRRGANQQWEIRIYGNPRIVSLKKWKGELCLDVANGFNDTEHFWLSIVIGMSGTIPACADRGRSHYV
jgi:Ricin-type beta-trefoil lectin domain-like